MNTNRPVTIYISAASDLMAEREALARMVAALPVRLAWRIYQTPISETDSLDLEALHSADLHFLVMGSDIRAPVGLEWIMAHRAGRSTLAYLRRGVPRTPAGQVFVNGRELAWRPFADARDLTGQVQYLLAKHLLRHAPRYGLTLDEIASLEALTPADTPAEPVGQGEEAGRSAVILSRERFEPGEGVAVDESEEAHTG